MFKRFILSIGASAAAAAALMLGSGTALAQHHGGGGHGGGGGHAGVSHGGGSSRGGGGSSSRGGNWDRGRGDFRGFDRGYGWGGYPYYGRWGYGQYSGYYPYYSDYYPYYGGAYAPDYDYGYMPNYNYGYQPDSYGANMTTAPANAAQITVRVPDADAQVWFEGQLTSQRGTTREFESPELNPGSNYTYDVRARWNRDGRTVDQTRQIVVRAGSMVNVDFSRPQPPAQLETSTGR